MAVTTVGFDLSELMELAFLLVAAGGPAGFLAYVFGIGGGAVLVPVFYERFRRAGVPLEVRMPLRDVAALQLPFAVGYVSLIGAALMMPTSLLTAPPGVRAAHAMSKRTLEIAFGCYLFIVGGRFVISLMSGQ